jgi:hypothetical protein
MKYVKLYEDFVKTTESKELPKPSKQILLDGTSSSGKSAAIKDLDSNWCVIAVDSFYNLMFEEAGEENFGNGSKPSLSEIYPGCPYSSDPNNPQFENAARWFMAQEVKFGKILQNNLKDAKKQVFGRKPEQTKVIYDDVESYIIEEAKNAKLGTPTWVLVHAPIDHLKLNVERRNKVEGEGRALDHLLLNSYCSKFRAKPIEGGVDPEKSWTRSSIEKELKNTDHLLLSDFRQNPPDKDWVDQFISKLGIKDDKEYWIYSKQNVNAIVNTRSSDGGQMTPQEVASAVKKSF